MGLVVYNTLSGKKEPFQPLHPNRVRMYVCGLTVYDAVHIGHARTYVAFDVIKRYLEFKGFEVVYVQNITDVDDKLIQRSEEMGAPMKEIAEENIRKMFIDFDRLGIHRATHYPRASKYIDQMQEVIAKLIEKGKAYTTDGDVFFDVESFPEYGKLSHQKLDKLKAGVRKEVAEGKRSPQDFALWKANKGEDVKWSSPWGEGRPGWHIECSTMSQAIFSDTIDIHGGGRDLIFPHHENEIAQSEALLEKPFVKYWIHTGFLNVKGDKMSKSLHNFITVEDYLKKHSAEAFRLMVLTHHYRTPIDFSYEKINESEKTLRRFNRIIRQIQSVLDDKTLEETPKLSALDKQIKTVVLRDQKQFFKFLDEDFNTPAALSALFDVLKQAEVYLRTPEKTNKTILKLILRFFEDVYQIFGVFSGTSYDIETESLLPGLLKVIIDLRNKARDSKDWKTADKIRDELRNLGIELQDNPEGTEWAFIPSEGNTAS